MKERRVVLSPEARDDLFAIYDWIAVAASPVTAMKYVDRIEAFCWKLSVGSERGSLRNDIRQGLRVIGFRRRITIALVVEAERVVVLRLFNGGKDWEKEL